MAKEKVAKPNKALLIEEIKKLVSEKAMTLDEIVAATNVSKNTAYGILKSKLGLPGEGRGAKRTFSLVAPVPSAEVAK